MPQLQFGDFAPQLIWLALTFIVLYLLMARVALPRIANVLEERRDRIASDLAYAEQLRRETQQAIAAYEQALADARARAHGIAQQTRDRLNEELERERAKIEAQIAEQVAKAEAQIAKSREAALGHVREIADDAAAEIVSKLIGKKLEPEALSSAVAASAGH